MIVAARRRRLAFLLTAGLLLAACGGTDEAGPPQGAAAERPEAPSLVIETTAGPVEVAVEVADTDAERARGLMDRERLPEDAGMVFLHDGPTGQSFWMKNTLIPLSLAVWDGSGEILAILDMEPCEADPCMIYDPGVAWVGAVEVNQGFFERNGVEIGDTARLEM